MRISVKVKANSKEEKVSKIALNELAVSVKAPAKEGKANTAVIRLLSEYFDVPKTRLQILRGHKSRNKVLELL